MSGRPMVVFDLGGVVVRICRSWREACAAAGEPFHDAMAEPQRMAARKPLVQQHERGQIGCEEFFEALARTSGGMYTAAQVRRVHEAWILEEYAGVGALMDDLHSAGVMTGVLSNTNASHWRQLTSGAHGPARFPTAGKARHVHASHLLGLAKPSPEIFSRFEALTGVKPASIVFFEDTPENVEGARRAGWNAVQIDHTGDTAAQMRLHLAGMGVLGR